jgi:hypothetical protein
MAGIYSPIKQASTAPELATALGDMMLAWTAAELAQVDAFAVLLNTSHHKASRLYQKLPNFRSRTQALLVLIELHPDFDRIKPVVLKISSLSKTRNDWVHGSFIRSWTGDDVRAVNNDEPSESPKRSKPIKAADIYNHANAVRGRALELDTELREVPAFQVWSEAQIEAYRKGEDRPRKPSEDRPPPEKT